MKRTSAQIRKDAVSEVAKKDAAKKKKNKSGKKLRQVRKETTDKSKLPGAAYRNPRIVLREVTCCLDKERPLPMSFKVCADCPGPQKITKAGSKSDEASVVTEAG